MNPRYQIRYFSSYSGMQLPLNLIGEISEQDLNNRNTYYEGHYDSQNRLCICRKIVYGENELEHHYQYDNAGVLTQAIVNDSNEDETATLSFDTTRFPN